MIKIYNQEIKNDKDKYNFVIEEKWIKGWGKQFACGRAKPKFYIIKENDKVVLSTTIHQLWYAQKITKPLIHAQHCKIQIWDPKRDHLEVNKQ